MPNAIALLSGGLDSTLSIIVLLRQGIDVTALTFLTHFGCDITDSSSCSKDPFPAAERFGFKVKLSHLGERFLAIVKNPKFGHGRNMNPCIDCRILMLKEAKDLMDAVGADFIITGEVLGQRPMSQKKDTLAIIAREAGLDGLVLRPLSARLLPITIPEERGIVDRERLYDFHGRSRKSQMAIAREFGLTEYPAPAGGCLLTDPIYSRRLKDLLLYTPEPDFSDLNLLKVGRHFRISDRCKVIVGRDKRENGQINGLLKTGDYLLEVKDTGSPLVILRGEGADGHIGLTASICARYSDKKNEPQVEVTISRNGSVIKETVRPAHDDMLNKMRIN